MTALAEAFVALRSDDTLLRSDVRRDAGRAADDAGTIFGKRFSTKAKAGIALAGVGLLGGITAALRTGKGEVLDYQTGLSNLQSGLKSTGGVAGLTADDMEKLAGRIQNYSGQTDDSIVKTEQLLLTFTNIRNEVGKNNDVFTQTVEIAADMAQRLGGDASSAAIQLGKALNDPAKGVTALTRVGVSFTDQQKEQIASLVENNQLLDAQKIILGELRKEFGGSAAAFGATDAGEINRATREWEDLSQQLTTELIPAFRQTIGVVRGTTKFVQENESWLKPLAVGILAVVGALKLYSLQGKIAAGTNTLLARSAVATTGALVAEGAAARNLGPMFARPGTPAAVPRGRFPLGGAAAGAAGFGAIVAGQQVGGHGGAFLSGAGTGALVGSSFGPVGALVGAGLGGGAGFAKSFTGNNLDPAKFNALAGTAAGRAQLQQIVKLGGQIPMVGSHLQDMARDALAAAKGEDKLGDSTKDTTDKVRSQSKALLTHQSKLLDLAGGLDSVRQAVHNMAVTVEAQGSKALHGNSDAALANRDALRGAVSEAESYIQTLKDSGAPRAKVLRQERDLARAIKTSAGETYGDKKAVDRLLRSLGFMPGQIQAVIDKYNELHAVAFNPQQGTGANSPFRDPGHPGYVAPAVKDDAKKAGEELAKSVTTGFSSVADPGIAEATAKATRDAAKEAAKAAEQAAHEALQAARSRMRQDFRTIKQEFASEKQSLISAFGTLSTDARTDSLGASFGGPVRVNAQLRADARQMETFAHLWTRLDDKHLDPDLLAQFRGPEYIPAMQQLLRGGRQAIRRANRLEGRIERAAGRVAQESTSDRYSKLIHEDLQDLPPRIARSFERNLHKIHIHVDFDKVDRGAGRRVVAGG